MKVQMLIRVVPILFASVAASFAADVSGGTVAVNCDANTQLQRIINHARAGDTILLSGTCQGPVTISTPTGTLTGTIRVTAPLPGI